MPLELHMEMIEKFEFLQMYTFLFSEIGNF